MDDFLGTSIQFAEQEIKRLETEHAMKMEQTVQNLIENGFLDSDFEGPSGRYSSDSDIDIDIYEDEDDYLPDDNLLLLNESYSPKSKETESIIDNFDIHSDEFMTDDIMKQKSMKYLEEEEERKYHSTDNDDKSMEADDESMEEDEDEINDELINNEIKESESCIFLYHTTMTTLSLSAYSLLSNDYDEDRESDTDYLIGSDYYLTSDFNEESEYYAQSNIETKQIKTLLFQINTIIIDVDDMNNMNTNNIYQIIAEYSEPQRNNQSKR